MVIITTILFTLAIIYFLPSILAITRKQKSIVDIILLNTFLGWTIIGWFAALLWAMLKQKPPLDEFEKKKLLGEKSSIKRRNKRR